MMSRIAAIGCVLTRHLFRKFGGGCRDPPGLLCCSYPACCYQIDWAYILLVPVLSFITHHPAPRCAVLRCAVLVAEDGFEVAVLITMGELATVAGTQLRADVPEILPLVIDAIQDGSSPTKRLVAVSTLGQVRDVCV